MEFEDLFNFDESIEVFKDTDTPEIPEEPEEEEKTDFYYTTIPDFYDRVRSIINSKSLSISDSMIDYPENAPMAEMRIKARVPNWEELNEFKTSLFQTCIIYMTCYMLCPLASANSIIEQTTPDLTLKYAENKSNVSPCERYLWMIDDLIAEITGEEYSSFFGFRVTPGNANGCCRKVWDSWNNNAFNPLWSD